MPCYHPLKGFAIGVNPSGKPKYFRCSFNTLAVGLNDRDKWEPIEDEASLHNVVRYKQIVKDYVYQTCGSCLGCRLMYAKQWADRCMMEAQYHTENWFLTLTYDDKHLYGLFDSEEEKKSLYDHRVKSVDIDGVFSETASLSKRDLQLFWKRLRKECEKNAVKIRYYACGEYGDKTFRPHYHAIVFGLFIGDLKVYQKNADGSVYYTSEWLDSIWQNGRVIVASATPETMCYTARYVVKKQKGADAYVYRQLGIEPPFVTCSRRPGIARQWFDENGKKFLDQSVVHIGTSSGSKAITPPRYFLNLLEEQLDPAEWEEFKGRRLVGIETFDKLRSELTSEDYLAMLETQEAVVAKKVHLNRGAV